MRPILTDSSRINGAYFHHHSTLASEPKSRFKTQYMKQEEYDMPKRILQGTVVSDKNDKTVVVEVERRYTHPLYKKVVRRSKKYHAHDEANAAKVGDRVRVLPAHVDPTVALHAGLHLVDGDTVVETWPVDLRGW